MSSATVSTAVDARLAAFLSRGCPEVFHSIATPSCIWEADPHDVETIHAEAREKFESLLHRGSRRPPPPSGAVLVLQGEAGSGKTHLMRAFRTRAHSQGLGYCGYLQMTTETSNYARYMLMHLIDSLEQRYSPTGPSRTGLARLSTALLESVPGLTETEREAFCDGDALSLVDVYADHLRETEKCHGCDLELLRVMLHLERNQPQVRSRALKWLRCEAMKTQDCAFIGDAVPRTDDADPLRMLQQLAQLIGAVHGVPLVLLIDQLEDMANQSAPTERFLKVVDAITSFTDQVPNAIVVLACLEDYFKVNSDKLTKSKQDRLIRDPEPIRLRSDRTLDEIREMTARRLAHLYDTAEVEVDPADELYPFREEHLAPLAALRTRDVLEFLRSHHQRCVIAREWMEPDGPPPLPPISPPPPPELDTLWNDFHSSFQAAVPDEEDDLAKVLADAVRAAAVELPGRFDFACAEPDGRYLEVETHKPDNSVEKLLVAVCNASTHGVAFGKQIADLEQRAGEIPVAIVRTTDFPKTGKAMTQVAGLLKRDGRTVVAADADWRRMLAFEAFRKQHGGQPDFATWQKSSHPLSELESLKKMLALHKLIVTPPVVMVEPVKSKDQPTPPEKKPSVQTGSTVVDPPVIPTGSLVVGRTRGVAPSPVTLETIDLTRHAAFLGGSGSGKTTAALNLIEQLLARDIPAVLLDRKGDLCSYADPAAWERPLNDPAQVAARRTLRNKLDVSVFTPGEPNGRPLALPLVPRGCDQLSAVDREQFAQYAAAGLGSMMGFKSSIGDQAQRAILAKAIETLAESPKVEIALPNVREMIENQDNALLTAIGGTYESKHFKALGQRLLTLHLNNKQLFKGDECLDVDALLGTGPHARPGRVRLSIISTRFLGDAAKVDFWVSQLLVAISRWCARSPQSRLQAVFLFDEADQYLPATRKPATKGPMEDLLKRARSAGVGVFLATQSPGDFDYKCKENVMTWVIGRIKETTALKKLKPMLAAAKADVTDKLAGQATGDFYMVGESTVLPMRSNESLLRTEQLSENEITNLARATR